MAIVSFTSAFADTQITSLDQLTAGVTIKIYPYEKGDQSSYALACNENGSPLTSYTETGDGDEWALEDAGDGYYYLKNELGCYWAYQNNSCWSFLTCTTAQSSAVKAKLTCDSTNKGVCFWNQKDGKGLNNLFSDNFRYNWYSNPSSYNNEKNTTPWNAAKSIQAIFELPNEVSIVRTDSLKLECEIKAVCHIKVDSENTPVIHVVEIKFEESTATVATGESKQLIVTYNPANASNKTLTWTSAKPAVATVDNEGNVTGISEGKTIITAKTTDGSNLSINHGSQHHRLHRLPWNEPRGGPQRRGCVHHKGERQDTLGECQVIEHQSECEICGNIKC